MERGERGMYEEKRGYERLIVWQNAYKLRLRIYQITTRFPKIELRRISQMRDAARSIKQNIQEGYGKGSIKKYMSYLAISHDSTLEVIGDIQDCHDDKLISGEEFKELDDLAGRTAYLLKKLIQSLRQKQKEGTWIDYYEKREERDVREKEGVGGMGRGKRGN
ncbi:MAG: four helix bundle protein [Candidatus Margulisiibacteriota bacterium]